MTNGGSRAQGLDLPLVTLQALVRNSFEKQSNALLVLISKETELVPNAACCMLVIMIISLDCCVVFSSYQLTFFLFR